MSRRHRHSSPRSFVDGERHTIPDAQIETALATLNTCCAREIAMMVPARFHREQILPWFFRDEDLAKLRAVKGWVETTTWKNYKLLPDMLMQISYDGDGKRASTPAIEPNRFFPQANRNGPLMEAVRVMDEIHQKYGRVKHLLRWFNKHATLGAIRSYWPAAAALCPASFETMVEAPTRYNTPEGIGDMLPLIRETAGTVATMALVPSDIEPHKHINVKLTFEARKRSWDDVTYDLDLQNFNL